MKITHMSIITVKCRQLVSLVYLFAGLFSWKLRNDSVVTDFFFFKKAPSATLCHSLLLVISSSDAHFPSGVFSNMIRGRETSRFILPLPDYFVFSARLTSRQKHIRKEMEPHRLHGRRKNPGNVWPLDSALPPTTWNAFRFLNTHRGVPGAKEIWPGQRGRWLHCVLTQMAEARTPRRLGSWPSFWAFQGGTAEIAFSQHSVWPWGSQFTFLNVSSLSCKEWSRTGSVV